MAQSGKTGTTPIINEIKAFACRVCDWRIGPKNKVITGTYHAGNYKFKDFKITGERARVLIDILIKAEEA